MKKLRIALIVLVLLAVGLACANTAPASEPVYVYVTAPSNQQKPAGEHCTIETTIMGSIVVYEVAYGDAAQLFCTLLLDEYVEDVTLRQVYFIPEYPVRCSKYEPDIRLTIEVRSQDAWAGEELCTEFMK